MIRQAIAALAALLMLAACGDQTESTPGATETASASPTATAPAPPQRQSGGTLRVGDHSWTFVPSIQCSIYPGAIVSIAGHAESDPDVEIVIDLDPSGPNEVRIGAESPDQGAVSWHSVSETLETQIDGRQLKGTATFSTWPGGRGETAPGEFQIDC